MIARLCHGARGREEQPRARCTWLQVLPEGRVDRGAMRRWKGSSRPGTSCEREPAMANAGHGWLSDLVSRVLRSSTVCAHVRSFFATLAVHDAVLLEHLLVLLSLMIAGNGP